MMRHLNTILSITDLTVGVCVVVDVVVAGVERDAP